jgi:hypothetical protein
MGPRYLPFLVCLLLWGGFTPAARATALPAAPRSPILGAGCWSSEGDGRGSSGQTVGLWVPYVADFADVANYVASVVRTRGGFLFDGPHPNPLACTGGSGGFPLAGEDAPDEDGPLDAFPRVAVPRPQAPSARTPSGAGHGGQERPVTGQAGILAEQPRARPEAGARLDGDPRTLRVMSHAGRLFRPPRADGSEADERPDAFSAPLLVAWEFSCIASNKELST